uniref:Uncharacterized protein n=1 Tax=Rhizophora mucronata TaxID=61149 RepID=A0A2P2PV03_RHIMU
MLSFSLLQKSWFLVAFGSWVRSIGSCHWEYGPLLSVFPEFLFHLLGLKAFYN